MNEKELKENIEKIKQLLTLPDYDKIDAGIELTVSLKEPKIFEVLLKGSYKGESGWISDYQPYSNPSCSGELLNNWMKSTITSGGELNDNPTGYYIYLSLLLNNSLTDLDSIRELNLTNGYLTKLPKSFSKLQNIEKLNLQLNKLEKFPDEVFELKKLTHLYLGWNNIKTIPNNISELEKLQSLMIGNNIIENIPESFGNLTNLEHLDIGSNRISEFPSCIFNLKKLININFFNDDYDDFNNHSKQVNKALPNCYIIQPVNCNECSDDSIFYRVEDMFDNEYGYVCEGCYEPADLPGYYCECCNTFVAPRGYTGGSCENSGNNQNLNDGYDHCRWYIDATVEYDEENNCKTIIKEEDGSFSDKIICELCKPNLPETDKPSYEDAEKYAEEHGIEDWE